MIDVWFQQVATVSGGKRSVVELHCSNDAEALEVLEKLKTARPFLEKLIRWPTVDRAVDTAKKAAQY
jgi:hypothetical protein